jgi:microcystin-dependent protein
MSVFKSAPDLPVGSVIESALRNTPPGYLLCNGVAVNRSDYGSLFGAIVPIIGNPTMTIASPCVVTLTNHGFVDNDALYFTTTGALPTGLTANTLYFVAFGTSTANTFQVATSIGGIPINTSGTQSGVHSVYACPFGLGDGSTTFNVPDLRAQMIWGAGSGYQLGGTAGGATHFHGVGAAYAQITLESSGGGFFEKRKNVTAYTDTHTSSTVIGVAADSTSHSTAASLGGQTDAAAADLPRYGTLNRFIKT